MIITCMAHMTVESNLMIQKWLRDREKANEYDEKQLERLALCTITSIYTCQKVDVLILLSKQMKTTSIYK